MKTFTDREKRLIREFWSAKDAYEFSKTRDVLAYRDAEKRMQKAVEVLVNEGAIQRGPMPTLDQIEANHAQ